MRREAMEQARQTGDVTAVVYALTLTSTSNRGPERTQERLSASAEVLELASGSADTDSVMDVYSWHISDLLQNGDGKQARAAIELFQDQAEKTRQPFYSYVTQSFLSALDTAEGRFDASEQRAQAAQAIGQRLRGQDHSGVFAMRMFAIRKEQGRLQEVLPAVKIFLQNSSANAAWTPGLALIYSELDMETEARAEFESLAKDDFEAIPEDGLTVLSLVYLAEVCAFLGDADRAETLYQRLQPWDGQNVVVAGGVAYCGAASRYLGLLATVMERWETSEEHFLAAVEMDRAMGARTWLSHTQHDYAKMLLARDASGDREKASSLIDHALQDCGESGMLSLQTRLVGLKPDRVTPPIRNPNNPSGLTQREVDVIKLVATGMTDREVAGELLISVGTVNTHVKNILNKTGTSNRTEAAAYAIQSGLA
ncbi:MAG: response regulator transcription factor [Chloroflexi bacterium]|nr:response regulator transcription factor [Chloroflexota bacterium]